MDLFSADRDPRRLAKLNWPWTPLWCNGFVQVGNLNIVPDRTEQPLLIPWTQTPNTEMVRETESFNDHLAVSPPPCLPLLLTFLPSPRPLPQTPPQPHPPTSLRFKTPLPPLSSYKPSSSLPAHRFFKSKTFNKLDRKRKKEKKEQR